MWAKIALASAPPQVEVLQLFDHALVRPQLELELPEHRRHAVDKDHIRIGDVDGFIKLLFHRDTHALLGVHVICEQATELVHIGQAVMRLGGGLDYFLETLMTYPSLSIAYKYAAYDALGELQGPATKPTPLS